MKSKKKMKEKFVALCTKLVRIKSYKNEKNKAIINI